MEDPNNIKFRLVSISNEKTTTIPGDVDLASISEESLQFQYKIGTIIKFAENTITVVPSIRYMFEGAALFESSAEFNYSVLSLDAVMDVDKENKKLNMKVNIFPVLLGAAYSSLRGIVYARTLTTPLEKYPLPMIDINTLLSKNGISVME
jgi:hypothetical protein